MASVKSLCQLLRKLGLAGRSGPAARCKASWRHFVGSGSCSQHEKWNRGVRTHRKQGGSGEATDAISCRMTVSYWVYLHFAFALLSQAFSDQCVETDNIVGVSWSNALNASTTVFLRKLRYRQVWFTGFFPKSFLMLWFSFRFQTAWQRDRAAVYHAVWGCCCGGRCCVRMLLASETELGRGATRSCDALSAMLL